jgi:hypothetical protein
VARYYASSLTEPVAFRITKEQRYALRALKAPHTASIVVRALLAEYLAGRLPEVEIAIDEEILRTHNAVKSGQRALTLVQKERAS